MKVIINGLAVNYQEQGAGSTILLLHGWGANLGTFEQLAADLAPQYHVVRLDFPGFGGSERPREVWGVDRYAALIQAFAAKLGLDPAIIIGHSFGGRVAIVLAARHMLAVQKLILLDSAGVAQFDSARSLLFRVVAKTGKAVTSLPFASALRQPLKKKLYKAAGSTDYLAAGAMKDIFLRVIREDLQAEAAQISLPTLLIWGEDDIETPLEEGRTLAGLIQNSRLEVLTGANHFVYLDKPDQVASLIKDFIND